MIGDRIKDLREKKGMDLKTLSKKSGICLSSLYGYENNKHTPNAITCYKLAKVLGCEYSDLVE